MLKSFLCFLLVLLVSGCTKNPVSYSSGSKGSFMGTVTAKYFYPVREISSARVFVNSSLISDSALTDSNGSFQFPELPPGHYSVNITADTYDPVDTTIEVVSDEAKTLAIEMPLIYRYELGTVLVGFKDSTTVESAFELFSSLNLTVKSLMGFDHQSNLPTDSLSFVRSALESKPYLTETDYTIFVADGVIRIVGGFNNLDSAKMADWERTKTQLEIVSVPSSYRDGNIQTESGQEIFWVCHLSNYQIVKWLVLDYYVPIGPSVNRCKH